MLDPPGDSEECVEEETDEAEVIVEPLHQYEIKVHLTNLIHDEILV